MRPQCTLRLGGREGGVVRGQCCSHHDVCESSTGVCAAGAQKRSAPGGKRSSPVVEPPVLLFYGRCARGAAGSREFKSPRHSSRQLVPEYEAQPVYKGELLPSTPLATNCIREHGIQGAVSEGRSDWAGGGGVRSKSTSPSPSISTHAAEREFSSTVTMLPLAALKTPAPLFLLPFG